MLIKLVTIDEIFLSSSRAVRAVVAEINNFSSAHVPTMIDESFYIAMSLARCSFFHATLGSLNFAFPPQIVIIFSRSTHSRTRRINRFRSHCFCDELSGVISTPHRHRSRLVVFSLFMYSREESDLRCLST